PEIGALFERMARRHDRRPGHIPHAQRLVHTALTAPIRAGDVALPDGLAASAVNPRREVEFLFPIPEPAHPLLDAGRDPAGAAVAAGARGDDGDSDGRDSDGRAWPIDRGVVKGYIDLLFEHDGRV